MVRGEEDVADVARSPAEEVDLWPDFTEAPGSQVPLDLLARSNNKPSNPPYLRAGRCFEDRDGRNRDPVSGPNPEGVWGLKSLTQGMLGASGDWSSGPGARRWSA